MTHSALGIDISKQKFDVALLRDNGKFKHRVFPNTPTGFLQLSAWLEKQKVERVHACLEATGMYSEAVATYLSDAGRVVSAINPAAIKAYGQSRLSRTKTDKADASLIASEAGAPRLCKALYFPAIVPMRYNPHVRLMSERLKGRGKRPMQIIEAAMRKLVHLGYGVLKAGKPFDPELRQILPLAA